MKKVMIAGGSGFIGSHLVDALVRNNYEVIVVDDLSSGLESNLSKILNKIEFLKCDIATLKHDFNVDIIINLASRASRVEWETFPVEVALSNSIGNDNLIKIALKNDAMYLYASSSEIYGNPDVFPTPESYIGRVSTTGSRSSYDEGKRFGEALIKAYEKEYGLKNIIMRFFNTYGPRMRGGNFYGRVVDRFIQQAINEEPLTLYGNGNQTRSFTYVSDAVQAILLLLKKGSPGEIYNVGNDNEIKILELADKVISMCKSNSSKLFFPLPESDPLRRSADISKIRSLGFTHRVSLERGLINIIEQFELDQKE